MDEQEIAFFHRSKAKALIAEAKAHTDMADRLAPVSRTSASAVTKAGRPADADEIVDILFNRVTIEQLRDYLQSNGGRVGHVAHHFEVPESEIVDLIAQPDSGIHIAPRGWLKLTSNRFEHTDLEGFNEPHKSGATNENQ